MIGLASNDLADAARSAFGGLLDAEHDVARLRTLRSDPLGFDPDVWRRIAEDGWLGARVPEASGGAGLEAASAAAILDLIGTRLVPEPYIACGLLPSLLLAAAAPGHLRLDDFLRGERRYAVAWQERARQVDPLGDVATRVNDGVLDGTKRFVVGGADADVLLVSAIDDSGAVCVVSVDGRGTGVSVRPVRQIDGAVSCEIEFRAVKVDSTICEGAALVAAIDEARIAVAVQLLGIAREALRITVDYAGTRRQFGRAIGAFQALQHRMVDFATRIRLSEVACDAALAALDRPGREGGGGGTARSCGQGQRSRDRRARHTGSGADPRRDWLHR